MLFPTRPGVAIGMTTVTWGPGSRYRREDGPGVGESGEPIGFDSYVRGSERVSGRISMAERLLMIRSSTTNAAGAKGPTSCLPSSRVERPCRFATRCARQWRHDRERCPAHRCNVTSDAGGCARRRRCRRLGRVGARVAVRRRSLDHARCRTGRRPCAGDVQPSSGVAHADRGARAGSRHDAANDVVRPARPTSTGSDGVGRSPRGRRPRRSCGWPTTSTRASSCSVRTVPGTAINRCSDPPATGSSATAIVR